MGWFWGSSESSGRDPADKLDPSLRSYLDSQSPTKYESSYPIDAPTTSSTESPSTSEFKYSAQLGLVEDEDPFEPKTVTERDEFGNHPVVSKKTLYPDGRYAHLWNTYRPLGEIENETKTEQERLQDVLEGYKERKAQISRAALENCADFQTLVSECFRSGSWSARFTMCRAENRAFGNCYTMQAKFLKALGYLSLYERPPEVEEAIQMHADTLYHRMLNQQEAIEDARDQGLPIPSFPPLLPAPGTISTDSPIRPVDAQNANPEYGIDKVRNPKMRKNVKARLDSLSPAERELEERAINAELASGQVLSVDVDKWFQRRERLMEERREKGKSTFGDYITRLLRYN
ncbi:MAG: hypothetical protein M1825_005219 [Sarcosagium campestre]|nr:MAG: hypothetical protein M1825_005219 [Sarcosagium campestre]